MMATPSALRRDRLGASATSQLARRVSLVDLVSSGSESSVAAGGRRSALAPAPAAATAATAAAQAPQTVVLSGSEAASQPASIGEL